MLKILTFIGVIFSGLVSAEVLIFAYGPGNGPPFAMIEGGQLKGGLFKDMGDALAKHAGLSVAYRHVPTKRASDLLVNGEVNALCMTNPDWIEGHNQLFWSPIIARDYDQLISLHNSSHTFNNINDVHGMTVGAMTGYIYYPQVMELFANKKAIRQDFNDLEIMYASLFSKQVNTIVDSLISINFRKKNKPNYKNVKVSKLVVYQYDLYCAFNMSLLAVKGNIQKALKKMLDNNEFEKIINRYK